jgi:CCR4-NOT transcription complex subunit 7/8
MQLQITITSIHTDTTTWSGLHPPRVNMNDDVRGGDHMRHHSQPPTTTTHGGGDNRHQLTTTIDSAPRGAATDHERLVVDVWAHNLEQELGVIAEHLEHYPFLAMDTEFPGIVATPNDTAAAHLSYRKLKLNVDLLKVIQLGICLTNEEGVKVPGVCVWQFNFKWSLEKDLYAQDSIALLQRSGIDFSRHAREGIDATVFGELLTTTGIVLNDEVTWVSFHSGYDFGYLLKLLTCEPLPDEESDFFKLMGAFFPRVFDMKYLLLSCGSLHGGLQRVANDLGVLRVGAQHQVGSITPSRFCQSFLAFTIKRSLFCQS